MSAADKVLLNSAVQTIPSATSTVAGVVRLTGDLAGTSASPTVPALLNKLEASNMKTVGGQSIVGSGDIPFPVGVSPATATPLANAQTGSVGSSVKYAREDHVHKETLTSLGYNSISKVLTYNDEAGIPTAIDLSALAVDLVVNGASITGNTLTMTVNDAGTATDVVVDLSTLKTVNVGGSVVGDGNTVTLKLDGDLASPGNLMVYGTDSSGVKGWQALSASVQPASVTPTDAGTADIGISLQYARADHVHRAETGGASVTTPLANGTAVPGVSNAFAREDHVHPLTATDIAATATSTGIGLTSSSGTGTTIQLSTPTLAGAMSPTDKTNLDTLPALFGVASGASNLGAFSGVTIPDNTTIKGALQALETEVESQQVTGRFIGSSATFATLPTTGSATGPAVNGDWSTLTADDGANLKGVYIYNGSAYSFAFALASNAGVMQGATAGAVGIAGLVPAANAGEQAKVLSAAGTWVDQPGSVSATPLNHAAGRRATSQAFTTAASEAAPQAVQFSEMVSLQGGITLNTGTGDITIPAGTYRIEGGIGGSTTASQVLYRWFVAGAPVGSIGSVFAPSWAASNGQVTGHAVHEFTVASSTVVKLCVTVATSNVTVGYQPDGLTAGPWFAIQQLPTATVVSTGTVPVTVLASGQNNSIADSGTVSGTTYIDVVGSSIVLPNAGSYEVNFALSVAGSTTPQNITAQLVTSGGVTVNGSVVQQREPSGSSGQNFLGGTVQITGVTTGAGYKLQIKASTGTVTVFNSATNGNSRVVWKQLPTSTVIDPGSIAAATGATGTTAGTAGYAAISPVAGDNVKALFGDGTFKSPGSFATATLTNNTVATTETVVSRFTIPAGSFVAGESYNLNQRGQVSGTATLAFRIRMGTTGTISDPLLCTFSTSAAGVANGYHSLDALVSVLSATTAHASGTSQLVNAVVGVTTGAFAPATVNLAVANFLSVTLVQSAAQTYTSRACKLTY
jgi:hypothetical protein